jgi:hypothetical protein
MRSKKSSSHQSEISLPAPVSALLHDISTTAKMLGTTTFAVRTLCRSGELKFVHIGHRWLVSTSAMQDFIRKAEQGVA